METKICKWCWIGFNKPKRKTKKEFEKMKFCSHRCINLWRPSSRKWKKLTEEHKSKIKFYTKWHIPWNKWIKYTKEQKEKMDISGLGKWQWRNKWLIYTNEQKSKINMEWLKKGHWIMKWKHHTDETKKKIWDIHRWKIISEEMRKKLSDYNKSIWKHPPRFYWEEHWNWQWWISNELYPRIWNNKLKEMIRKRDWNMCRICWWIDKRKLCVHHIDYNKDNCEPTNLITLCNSCHAKTNQNRKEWKKYFKKFI